MSNKHIYSVTLLAAALAACGEPAPVADHGAATARANAAGMPELAIQSGCTACHALDSKSVGPAWRDVANRYKGATSFRFRGKEYPLEEGLMLKLSQGGSGNWGSIPMIAADPDGVRQAELRELLKFTLALAK